MCCGEMSIFVEENWLTTAYNSTFEVIFSNHLEPDETFETYAIFIEIHKVDPQRERFGETTFQITALGVDFMKLKENYKCFDAESLKWSNGMRKT